MSVQNQRELILGRYKVVDKLGGGGMGIVWKAIDIKSPLDRSIVAIKEVREESSGLTNYQGWFEREARLLRDVGNNHPNLPSYIDYQYDQSKTRHYLVMEYIDGENLWQVLQKSKDSGTYLGEKLVLSWIEQVMDALEFMHTQLSLPVLHRDIKPDNIVIRRSDRRVFLVDLGLSKYHENHNNETGINNATPGYAPPELYRKATEPRSDIYSLGATLYTLLTKEVPPNSLRLESRDDILRKPSELNSKITPRAEKVILTAMHPSPAGRYKSVQKMRKALNGTLWNRNITLFISSILILVLLGGLGLFFQREVPDIISQNLITPLAPILDAPETQPSIIISGTVTIQETVTPNEEPLPPTASVALITSTMTIPPSIQPTTTLDEGDETSLPNTSTPLSPTQTYTDTPEPTEINTSTATLTPFSTATPRPTATNSEAPEPTATYTPTLLPTATPTATSTNTPSPTVTNTPTPRSTATSTATPTNTHTPTPSPTETNTSTPRPTATSTPTRLPTATNTYTPLPTPTSSPTPVVLSESTLVIAVIEQGNEYIVQAINRSIAEVESLLPEDQCIEVVASPVRGEVELPDRGVGICHLAVKKFSKGELDGGGIYVALWEWGPSTSFTRRLSNIEFFPGSGGGSTNPSGGSDNSDDNGSSPSEPAPERPDPTPARPDPTPARPDPTPASPD